MGQEELASTVNISAIQAKRALAQLKEEGAIELKCGEIIIKNIEVVKKHISETLYTQEEQKVSILRLYNIDEPLSIYKNSLVIFTNEISIHFGGSV